MEAMSMADGGDEKNGNVDGITLRCDDGTAVGIGWDMTVVVSFVVVIVVGAGGGIRIVHRIHSKNSDGALSLLVVVLDVVESVVTKVLPRLLLLVLVVVPIVGVNDKKTNRTRRTGRGPPGMTHCVLYNFGNGRVSFATVMGVWWE